MIKVSDLKYVYQQGMPFEQTALSDISFEIPDGDFVAIIGHTGSGKSTLIQHLNALIKPTSGKIEINGVEITKEGADLKAVRREVGLVFQYPEHQLFEVDVISDVAYGPRNQGLDKKEAQLKAFAALKQVGLEEEYYYQSPFDLSGGQKRRVAIAGVLAMEPEVLILDEPTAGLDPKGRDEIFDCICKLREKLGITVILVSHSMEDVAKYVDRIIVMNQGRVLMDDVPKEIFKRHEELEEVGLSAPQVTYIMEDLRKKGLQVDTSVLTIEEARDEILRALLK